MNFLWDIVLRAQAQGIGEEDLFFCQAKEYSPFYEQAFPCLNEREVPEGRIELNLLLRFDHIFQDILAEEESLNASHSNTDWRNIAGRACDMRGEESLKASSLGEYLVDAALHMLLYTDLRHGLSKRDIYIRKIRQEMEQGVFWRDAAKVFGEIPMEKRNRLAAMTLTQMQTGSSLMIFRKSVRVLFPDAVIYQLRDERKKILLYLREDRTEARETQLRLLQDMFLPVSYELRVFWKYHFGIIGVNDTMQIDKIAIY